MRHRRGIVGLVAVGLGLVSSHSGGVRAAEMYQVTDLGTARPIALNDAGQVVAGEYHGEIPTPGVPIVSYNMATLYSGYGPDAGRVRRVGGDRTSIVALNNAGQMVTSDSGTFVLTDGTHSTLIGVAPGGRGLAMAVNDAGQVLGTGFTGPDSSPTGLGIWRAGQVTPLSPVTGMTSAWGTAVNNAGQAVGTSNGPDGSYRATLWGHGQALNLGTLGGSLSGATGLNDAGVVVGWSNVNSSTWHAFVYRDGRMTDLGTLPGGDTSSALAINAAGDIVGTSSTGIPGSRGFLYHAGNMLDLNTAIPGSLGLTVTSALGINSRGQILAVVRDGATGFDHAALLTPDGQPVPADPIPVPEPTGLTIAAAFLLVLGARNRRVGGVRLRTTATP